MIGRTERNGSDVLYIVTICVTFSIRSFEKSNTLNLN